VIGSDLEFRAVGVEPTAVVSGERVVYLKLGERGARYLDRETTLDAPSIPVETVCGIGSGDAFAAAVVEGLVRGFEPAETLRRGNAAGAIVATRMTCSQAMPTQAEIASLLEASATAAWALVKPGARP
jgi:5-dehydro-2-deoxygluconokinase